MNRLIEQLQRLHFAPGSALTPELLAAHLAGDVSPALVPGDTSDAVRVLIVSFLRASDWPQVQQLYRCAQEELGLPAPAIAVAGSDGFQLWLPLAEPQPLAQAAGFLAGLSRRYLGELPAGTVAFHPGCGESERATQGGPALVPALDRVSGRWSAFIDPSLGSMFIDESGLETPPNMDAQAELLARLESITAADFAVALSVLASPAAEAGGETEQTANAVAAATSGADRGHTRGTLAVDSTFADPKSFLLAVMNDPSASAKQRIRAARALLPYFAQG